MSDLIKKLEEYLLDNKISNIPEIKFLQDSDLIFTLNRGFTELYRAKPKNPILFLSKWLSRESLSKELAKKYQDNKTKCENLQIKYYQQEKQKHLKQQRDLQQKKVRKDDEDSLITEIKSCKDFWLGFNHICQRLKELSKATGCYLGIYDLKRRQVETDDDETGHIDPSNAKVIRYIGWNDDHNFLEGQFLEQNEGVTFDLIFPQQKTQKQEGEGESNNQEKQGNQTTEVQKKEEMPKENGDELPSILIPDVVNESRIKFFREPRLGCYLALDLTYKTS
jgi:hypothetical protein